MSRGHLVITHRGETHVMQNVKVVFSLGQPFEDEESFLIRRGWTKREFHWEKVTAYASFKVGKEAALQVEYMESDNC